MPRVPDQFAVTIISDDRDRTITVTVVGEFDVVAASTFDKATERVMELDPSRLVVDISGVTLLDSVGIGAIMRLRKAADDRKVGFGVRAPAPFQQRLLTITGLDHLML